MKVERMLNIAEYKRRQAARGVKVTLKNFGRDRRYPITSRFSDPGTELPAAEPAPRKSPVRAKARAADFLLVIPGRPVRAEPGIHNPRSRGQYSASVLRFQRSGFRAPR